MVGSYTSPRGHNFVSGASAQMSLGHSWRSHCLLQSAGYVGSQDPARSPLKDGIAPDSPEMVLFALASMASKCQMEAFANMLFS